MIQIDYSTNQRGALYDAMWSWVTRTDLPPVNLWTLFLFNTALYTVADTLRLDKR